jgi:hypothetical protein
MLVLLQNNMAVTPEASVEISPPCLVNPTKDCHLPCLNFRACETIFTDSVSMFGTTRQEQRQRAYEEGSEVDNRRLLLNALKQAGIYQRCLPIMNLSLPSEDKKSA